mmetsp:Transcript_10541/g.32241  ORF Transcript_10541/g.32241 Transcript_10541/m.32241 type:complete len:305 (-) Transcript_10541:1010-1924(-)
MAKTCLGFLGASLLKRSAVAPVFSRSCGRVMVQTRSRTRRSVERLLAKSTDADVEQGDEKPKERKAKRGRPRKQGNEVTGATSGTDKGESQPLLKNAKTKDYAKLAQEMAGPGELVRCPWAKEVEIEYHDKEWGRPVFDDRKLFEFLILEGAQAGLSWKTIMMKRDHYSFVYEGFDPEKVAAYDDDRVEFMLCSKIVRHRGKIEGSIKNAQIVLDIQRKHGSLSKYLWSFVGGKPIINSYLRTEDYAAESEESIKMSKALKKKGFTFFGPKIAYAFMQATGMVNDHVTNCFCYQEIIDQYKALK